MDFFFLIVLTAVLMIRPEEVIPDLAGARLYLWSIVITTYTAIPKLRNLFVLSELTSRSILVCVLGYSVFFLISGLFSGHLDRAWEHFEAFLKVLLYYLLLIAILDTPDRLRQFLGWLVILVIGVTIVATLMYYDVLIIPEPMLTKLEEQFRDPDTGEVRVIRRALATGIFNDPNDLCLVLVLGMLCAFYHFATTPAPSAKIFWLLPIPGFFLMLSLTGSRGGMLGLLAGFATLVYAYRGLRRSIPLVFVGIFALLYFAGGRGADISGGGTARERLSLWGEGLGTLFTYPISIPFGLGPGWYVAEHGSLLAHNSFVNTYVEMGLFGGGFFLVAFLSALSLTDRIGLRADAPDWAQAMRPAMLAIVVAYSVGAFSLSRHLVLPTFLVLGLATAYINLAGPTPPRHVVTAVWFRWAFITMVLGLVGLKVLTQVLGMVIYR